MRTTTKLIACLCLLLTLWSAAETVSHHHSNSTEFLRCSVCVVLRTTVLTASVPVLEPIYTWLYTVTSESHSSNDRLPAFALSIRPPPTA